MLKDCVDTFKKIYEEKGDKIIIDNYVLSEGSYILVDDKGDIEKILEVNKEDVDRNDSMYYNFAEMDYLSRLPDMNMPVDSKKVIHSNNCFSFFIKKPNINPKKLTDEIIDNYYKNILYPEKKYDGKKKEMYLNIEKKHGKTDDKIIEKNKNWIKSRIYKIIEEENIKNDKNYLKIFFKADMEQYKIESEKYIIPNIYNDVKYNIKIGNEVLGLPNDNMGLNSKKPYLEHRTRKNKLPYLISEEEVILQKKFFDYLMNYASQGRTNIYISDSNIECLANDESPNDEFSGYFLKIQKGKEVEIQDFDEIILYEKKIKNLNIENVLSIKYEGKQQNLNNYGPLENWKDLRSVINEVYFSKYLTNNYFTKPKDMKVYDPEIERNILRYRKAFFDWLYKGNEKVIKQVFPQVSMNLIENSICNGYILRAKEQFNLRESIIKYFGGVENMGDILKNLSDKLREKISSNPRGEIDKDEEYYFAVGQLVSYLISKNKSNKKMHSLINPILNCSTDEKLKDELRKLFTKYNYDIWKKDKRFNNLYGMVIGYVPEKDGIIKDILIGGYLYSNLLYEKDKEEVKEDGKQEHE